jgi:hypothetical protein
MSDRRGLTKEEQEEVARLAEEEACIILVDFLGEGESMVAEEFAYYTPREQQIKVLQDWIQLLQSMLADVSAGDSTHFFGGNRAPH